MVNDRNHRDTGHMIPLINVQNRQTQRQHMSAKGWGQLMGFFCM